MAVFGLALALFGVAIAILATARVLAAVISVPEQLTEKRRYRPLRKYVDDYEVALLRHKADSLEDLVERTNAAQRSMREAREHALTIPEGAPGRKAADGAFNTAEAKHGDLAETVGRLQSLGLLLVVRRRFNAAVVTTIAGGLLAAAGAVLFAYWANPPKSFAPTTEVKARAKVHLILTPAGEEVVRHRIGPHCDLKTLKAIVLGGTDEAPDVVVIPARHCAALRLTVPPSIGTTAN